MKLTQKQVGQVAERLYQANQGCAGLQDRWAKLPGWGGQCVEGGQGVGSGVSPSPESSVPSRHLSLRPDGLHVPEPCARSLGSSQPGVGLR